MKNFEYAEPRTESEVLQLLREQPDSAILAGGTDLVGLLNKMVVTPERVVNIMEIPSLKEIRQLEDGSTLIGATVTLDELLAAAEMTDYQAVTDAVLSINSMQLQCQGTLGGEVCQRPRCWFFRNGQGLLGAGVPTVSEHRFHAIFGNSGPARFVSSSRLAPALMVLEAQVRVVGPAEDQERWLPLAEFYRTPRHAQQTENVLEAGQLISHVLLPPAAGWYSATYDVKHGSGPDFPMAAAAAALQIQHGVVRAARIVMGQVAPTPWAAPDAVRHLVGQAVTMKSAEATAEAAVAAATPLSNNAYKVQLAKTAVKRAIWRAAGHETGGF